MSNSLFWKIFVVLFLASFCVLGIYVGIPVQSVVLRISITTALGVMIIFGAAWYVSRPLNDFLEQLQILADSQLNELKDRKLSIYRNPPLDSVATSLNELVDKSISRTNNLRKERDKLGSILDEIPVGIVSTNRDEEIIYLNERAHELLHVESNDPQNHLVGEIVRLEEVQSSITQCLKDGARKHTEGRRVNSDEETILTVDASPLRDDEDSIVGAVAAIQDVTELRRLQTVRQDFVANVSHELKTPITAIQGLIETIAGDETMDEETRRSFMNKVRSQTQRMSNMVEDLLTISRLESDESPLDSKRFDIKEPIQQAADGVQPAASDKDHNLTIEIPDESIYLMGDPAALRQLVTNLLDNAIKYTPENGEISLEVRTDDDEAIIQVEDNGLGIEPRKQDRIFERFYRVDEARSREEGGTGLGLAIVKHLTLTLEGQISVESTPGQGSTFTVELPRQ